MFIKLSFFILAVPVTRPVAQKDMLKSWEKSSFHDRTTLKQNKTKQKSMKRQDNLDTSSVGGYQNGGSRFRAIRHHVERKTALRIHRDTHIFLSDNFSQNFFFLAWCFHHCESYFSLLKIWALFKTQRKCVCSSIHSRSSRSEASRCSELCRRLPQK